jgi:hypothetical protein
MSDIANQDKAHMTRLALIDSLYKEMENKVQSLSTEVKDNPGLRPVLTKYMDHINRRNDETRALQQYFHSLLHSLYQIEANTTKLSHKAIKQLGLDERAILFELNKLNKLNNVPKESAGQNFK